MGFETRHERSSALAWMLKLEPNTSHLADGKCKKQEIFYQDKIYKKRYHLMKTHSSVSTLISVDKFLPFLDIDTYNFLNNIELHREREGNSLKRHRRGQRVVNIFYIYCRDRFCPASGLFT